MSMSSSNTCGLMTSSSVGWVCDTPRMRMRLHMRTQGKRQTQLLKKTYRTWKIRSWASSRVEGRGITVDKREISESHLQKVKNPTGKPPIIVRCVNRKSKMNILKNGRLKGTNVYVNEHMSHKNADIAGFARQLKRSQCIHSTWTRYCKHEWFQSCRNCDLCSAVESVWR